MGCYVWGLGRCFGFGHGGFGLARGGFGLEWCGFWGYDFEGLRVGQGTTGWVRGLVRGVLGFGVLFWVMGYWVCGMWGCFGCRRVSLGFARDRVGIGCDGFGGCGFGVWGWAGLVRRLVGQVWGLGGLCWGMLDWELGLEVGIWVWVCIFRALAGSLAPATKNWQPVQHPATSTKKN